MADKERSRKKGPAGRKTENSLRNILSLYSELSELKRQVEGLAETSSESESRTTDLEMHINLLTRLLTTLCIEKFGLKVGVLRRLVKRIEKEAVRDFQIVELESLYQLPHEGQKKPSQPPAKAKDDPWDKIS